MLGGWKETKKMERHGPLLKRDLKIHPPPKISRNSGKVSGNVKNSIKKEVHSFEKSLAITD